MNKAQLTQQHINEYQTDVFNYLDDLHKNNMVSMYLETALLMERFDFPDDVARAWSFKWMKQPTQEKVI